MLHRVCLRSMYFLSTSTTHAFWQTIETILPLCNGTCLQHSCTQWNIYHTLHPPTHCEHSQWREWRRAAFFVLAALQLGPRWSLERWRERVWRWASGSKIPLRIQSGAPRLAQNQALRSSSKNHMIRILLQCSTIHIQFKSCSHKTYQLESLMGGWSRWPHLLLLLSKIKKFFSRNRSRLCWPSYAGILAGGFGSNRLVSSYCDTDPALLFVGLVQVVCTCVS